MKEELIEEWKMACYLIAAGIAILIFIVGLVTCLQHIRWI